MRSSAAGKHPFKTWPSALLLMLAAFGLLSAPALADKPLSSAAQSKIIDTGSNWANAMASTGDAKPIIVEFAMPELPSMPASASEEDRDKAHIAAVRGVQDSILSAALGMSSVVSVEAAQNSTDRNLKLMPFSPQFAIKATAGEIERFAADSRVVKIYEDQLSAPLLIGSVPLIGMPNAYTQGATGNGYTVAVLDTGASKSHEFLISRITQEACFSTNDSANFISSRCPGGVTWSTLPGSGQDCRPEWADGCGHGTMAAGAAAGFNTNRQSGEPANGVARDGRIMAINVFSTVGLSAQCREFGMSTPCLLSYDSNQISALNYVYSVRMLRSIASVTMSFGRGRFMNRCDGEAPQSSIINTLRMNDVVTVIAAGNTYENEAVHMPACISSAITVASSSKSDVRSSYSNWGYNIDVVAPGEMIGTPFTLNDSAYAWGNGTSIAAAHVAGAWAALRSRVPTASVLQIETALETTGLGIMSANWIKPRIRVDQALASLISMSLPRNNDDFENRYQIFPVSTTANGVVTFTGNNVGYTLETGEPIHSNIPSATTSAWWRFVPESSGPVTISTYGSSFDTVLAVYAGPSMSSLIPVTANDDYNYDVSYSQVSFYATSGTEYRIAVAGHSSQAGNYTLTVTGGGGTPTASASIVAAVTPVARRGVVGSSTPITAFATVISSPASAATAIDCAIARPTDGQPYYFAFKERLLPGSSLGAVNAPFSLTPGQARHFLLTFTPTAAMSSNLRLVFDCANTSPAPTTLGLNSFNLVATPAAGADVIAIAVTATNDGILRVPQTSGGANAVAMAGVNIGPTRTVEARLSTVAIGASTAPVPIGLTLCRTNPSTGACLSPPTASPISFTATSNTSFTFAGFASYSGTPVPLDPANKRIFIHFSEGSTSVGSASVAVTTVPPGGGASHAALE